MHASSLALVLSVFLVGCSGQRASSRAPTAPTEPNATELSSVAASSDRDALNQARTFAQEVVEGRASVSPAALVQRGFPAGTPPSMAPHLEMGATKLMEGFIAALRASIEAGDSFTVVRVDDEGHERRVLTRLAGGGLDYYEWVLVDGRSGRTKIADLYIYSTGEPVSKLMRRVFTPLLALDPEFDSSVLTRADRQFMEQLDKMKGFRALIESDPQQALTEIRALPAPLVDTKIVALMELRAASQFAGELGTNPEADAAYYEVCERFIRRFPDDPAVDLIGIDAWLENKQWARALGALDRLDQRVGEDGYLSSLRAIIHAEKGEFSKAATHAYAARRLEPQLVDVRWTLVDILAKSRRFSAAVDELRSIRDELGVEEVYFDEELYTVEPAWIPFYESSQYRAFEAEGQAALEAE